jgi:hypothetical protein
MAKNAACMGEADVVSHIFILILLELRLYQEPYPSIYRDSSLFPILTRVAPLGSNKHRKKHRLSSG